MNTIQFYSMDTKKVGNRWEVKANFGDFDVPKNYEEKVREYVEATLGVKTNVVTIRLSGKQLKMLLEPI